jgi:hypothetical protein
MASDQVSTKPRHSKPGVARPPEEPALLSEALAPFQSSGVSLDQLAMEAHLPTGDDLRELLQLHSQPRLEVRL